MVCNHGAVTPFDSFCLAAVTAELKKLVGARVQKVWQPDPLTVVLSLYWGSERLLLLSADPVFARAHLTGRRPGRGELPEFCVQLRKRLTDARLELVRQRGLDRVLELGFSAEDGDSMLVCELMGKHSNLMLVDSRRAVVAAAKWVGPRHSRRPILPGKPYEPPPFAPRPSLLKARDGDDLRDYEGVSPFLAKLIASGVPLEEVQRAVREDAYLPVVSPGFGAYPWTLESLGLPVVAKASISQALDAAFTERVEQTRLEQTRSALRGRLNRVLLARETALNDLEEAVDAAEKARDTQILGELILAYQGMVRAGDSRLTAWDMEGNEVEIRLDPKLSAMENAERYFAKAKRAKAGADQVRSQRERIGQDVDGIALMLESLELCATADEVAELEDKARRNRWLVEMRAPTAKEERPFEGHSVKELLSPGGYRVLYGLNATSNDYLTTRVAKPNDWWLHVRGATSAHVILLAGKAPEKVPAADLLFAAELAVRNSPSKHSSYVAVDYTLKKYVRKPRGSAAGSVTYTHEKTLHVDKPR